MRHRTHHCACDKGKALPISNHCCCSAVASATAPECIVGCIIWPSILQPSYDYVPSQLYMTLLRGFVDRVAARERLNSLRTCMCVCVCVYVCTCYCSLFFHRCQLFVRPEKQRTLGRTNVRGGTTHLGVYLLALSFFVFGSTGSRSNQSKFTQFTR